jgi:Cu(I)/Ag(I) efflux system membrane fusion protein
VIPAPTGGVVIGKDAVEGMYVKVGTPIYTVADLSTVWVKMEAYEADLKWLRLGQTVKFEAGAFPGEVFAGTVAFIDPVIDATTRTAKVRVNVPNPAGKLKPEMFVKALVEPSDSRDHGEGASPLVIPASAPLLTGTRAVVYVAVDRANGVYEGRDVELGGRAGDYYIVKSGLEEGDLVVVNGAFKLDSDLQIRGKPSMMSPEGGSPDAGHQHHQMPGVEKAKEAVATHESHDRGGEAPQHIPKAFSASIQRLLDSYLEVQKTLAGDDETGARDRLKRVSSALEGVDMSLVKGDAHMLWMKNANLLKDVVKRMTDSQSIDELRTLFADLTVAVIDSVKMFGGKTEKTLYRFHCPMALNDKGAYWLQDHPEPRNPYFGASMLICHDLKEEWKPEGGS